MPDIVLVDDHPLLAAGLKAGLATRDLTLEAAPELDVEAVLAYIETTQPRLTLLDYEIPPIGPSTELIRPIANLGIDVLMLTGKVNDALWGSFLAEGALGVIGKDEPLDDILDSVCDVLAGKLFRINDSLAQRAAWDEQLLRQSETLAPFDHLTERESNVLQRLTDGSSPREIAASEYVSIETVRSQLKSLFRKLGVSSQLEAVAYARRAGWVRTDNSG